MDVTNVTIDVTLDNLTLVLIAGTLAGMITGQLLKSRGLHILGDFGFSLLRTFLGVVVLGTMLGIGHFGFVGYLLLGIAGAMVTVVLAHVGLLVRSEPGHSILALAGVARAGVSMSFAVVGDWPVVLPTQTSKPGQSAQTGTTRTGSPAQRIRS